MKKSIILFYQHKTRELNAISYLKKELINLGYNVGVFNIDFEQIKAFRFSKKNDICCIVTPWLYNDIHYEMLNKFIIYNKNAFILNLHQEQIYSDFSENILMPCGIYSKNNVFHLAWGDFFKKTLIKYGVDENLIYVIGNPRNDEIFNIKTSKNDFSKKYDLNIEKKWILFADNRGWTQNFSDIRRNEWLSRGHSNDEIDDYLYQDKKSLEISVNELDSLGDSFFLDKEVVFRNHPGTPAPIFKNKNIKVISQGSIYEWLKVSDLIIIWSSTSIFEGDALGKPGIVFEPIPNGVQYKTKGIDNYLTIKSIYELDNKCINNAIDKIKEKNYYDFYGNIDGKVNKKLAKVIDNITHESKGKCVTKILPLNKKITYKHFLFEAVTFFMFKLKLLKRVKIPKSALNFYDEIPY